MVLSTDSLALITDKYLSALCSSFPNSRLKNGFVEAVTPLAGLYCICFFYGTQISSPALHWIHVAFWWSVQIPFQSGGLLRRPEITDLSV